MVSVFVFTSSRKWELNGLKGKIVKDHLLNSCEVMVDKEDPCGKGCPDDTKRSGMLKFAMDRIALWKEAGSELVPPAGTTKRQSQTNLEESRPSKSRRAMTEDEEKAEADDLFLINGK